MFTCQVKKFKAKKHEYAGHGETGGTAPYTVSWFILFPLPLQKKLDLFPPCQLQHIEDLTQEKFALQRGAEAARSLAASLDKENSRLTEDFNRQAQAVQTLKAELERQQAEISAQQVRAKFSLQWGLNGKSSSVRSSESFESFPVKGDSLALLDCVSTNVQSFNSWIE